MKYCKFTRGIAALLLLALLAAALPGSILADGGTLFVTGYTLTNSTGKPVNSFSRGANISIAVTVKDTGDGSGQGDPAALDISKLEDSFTGGTLSVKKVSQDNQPLRYEILLSGLQYKGTGQSLKLQIGTAGRPESYQIMDVTITEAVVYEAPTFTPSEPSAPEAAPAPIVIISRSEVSKPMEPGQEIELRVSFQNLSNIKLKSPVATFTPSDALTIAGGASSFALDDIPAKKTGSVVIKVQAAAVIQSPSQSLNVELKFNYHNNLSMVQGNATEKLNIPAVGRESIPQPVVIVTRSPVQKPISAGETLNLTLTFQNAGSSKLLSPVASVTTSESLILLNETSTFLLKEIAPGQSESIAIQVKATKEISSSTQSISTELKYGYDNGETITQATASDRLSLSANVTSTTAEKPKPDASVPNIVIREFTYGGGSVASGSKFPLEFSFENTGKLNIENVVATVDGGETFAMDGSTNTFFYPLLAAGATQKQAVPMQVVPTGKSGAQSVSVSFKYEYVDGDKRSQATADIRISIPVYQPDRFQINAPAVPETVQVYEEIALSLSYVNKGRGDISNVEATVEGDGVDTPARTQYLGNILAGSSGNIGFALTPNTEGELKLLLKISYEDSDQHLQTKEFPVTLHAEEAPTLEDIPMDGEEDSGQSGGIPWLWIGVSAGVLTLLLVFLVRRRRARRRTDTAAACEEGWDNWDVPDSGSPGGEA